jgi:hypothetical protein
MLQRGAVPAAILSIIARKKPMPGSVLFNSSNTSQWFKHSHAMIVTSRVD